MADEAYRGFHRLARVVFGLLELGFRNQVLITSIDQVVQDFCLRPFCNSHEARELLVAVTPETFGDICGAGARRVR